MSTETEPPGERWRDTTATIDERVRDLLGRMSLREKVAQLYGVWVGVDEAGTVAPNQHDFTGSPPDFDELVRHGLGQLTRPFGTRPVDPAVGARGLARSQRQIVAAGRFGIPALVHDECLTGLAAWQATVYPAPLCWGASFDPELVRAMGARIGRTMRRLGVHQGLAPVLDVVRDPRWGRTEESIGEDPYLVGMIGSAYVEGLEGAGIVATLKHFVGYSASKAGRNLAPVSAGPREVADVLLPPFEMALRAGARSVMNAYTALDGVPTAADRSLLTDLLRDRYGFTGTVVSDYFAVAFLRSLHNVAADGGDAAAVALRAGVDVELPTVDCYGEPLLAALASGRVAEDVVDRAAARVLAQKCELGLLDPDWRPDVDGEVELDDPESRALARELAERSLVLLHNDGTLPLRGKHKLAVIGPRADEPGAMLGCYSFPQHVGVHHPGTPLGIDLPTVLDALRAEHDVTHARGCAVGVPGTDPGTDAELATAVALAAEAELCVLVLGDQAGLFGNGTSGEGCDAADLRLPGRQEELLDAVLATGTPVVLVLLSGRPYDLSRHVDRLAATVCGFFPGEEGAAAIAAVLAGRVDPSGRLPVSFPRGTAAQPAGYLGAPLARGGEASSIDPTPLFPFGHGLSYAAPEWVAVGPDATQAWPTDGPTRFRITLRNKGNTPATEVVQVYLHDPVAEVSRPVRSLIAAKRVRVEPGSTRVLDVDLHADLCSYTGIDGDRIVEEGAVELHVGVSSEDIRAVVHRILTGPRRVVGPDRVLHPRFDG
ncbi:beta-glucosidase family protein [Labedaea rhizosphaerae]|uniref:Beta-glucosidase n=1 Tax=Labedaea rhizosphaerae TaxID=598644 RepID=A0A4V3CZ59_LABRH|nr:glycoside hydrolase family 3 N-terminal domain-containing protein [Labedaea rhizosphaerae]TDP96778.1 beta-glucosidase [Labedaea rhizosphaerae]